LAYSRTEAFPLQVTYAQPATPTAPAACPPAYSDSISQEDYAGFLASRYYDAQGRRTGIALRPLCTTLEDPQTQTRDFYLLYPVFRLQKSPEGTRWSLFNLIQKRSPRNDPAQRRFRIFPFYSQGYSSAQPGERNVFPVRGQTDYFLGQSEVSWFLFPLRWRLRNGTETKTYAIWPLFRFHRGPGVGGMAVFPFGGHWYKQGVYSRRYAWWPLMYSHRTQLDKPVPTVKKGFLPFYTYESSAKLTSYCWVWPFFGYTHKYSPVYHETRLLWPLWVQGRGEQQYVNRWAPFYTHSRYRDKTKRWWIWPLLRMQWWQETPQVRARQIQLLYVLAWNHVQTVTSPSGGPPLRAVKQHLWPLVSAWSDGQGRQQVQLFSPLEPFFPHNPIIRRAYTPLFALYRFDKTADGQREHRFLWGAVTSQSAPGRWSLQVGPLLHLGATRQGYTGITLLRGLFAYQTPTQAQKAQGAKPRLRLLWLQLR
jgi:hypothetical protein